MIPMTKEFICFVKYSIPRTLESLNPRLLESFHYLLRKIALKIDRLPFVNMGSLFSYHGDAGISIKVVFIVLAAAIDEQILFFINKF